MPVKSNVFIRRAEREDLDRVVEWMEDPDFVRFLYGDPARSQKQIREQIVAMMGRSPHNAMPGNLYLILDSEEQGPIGLMSLQNISWRNRACSIDLYLGKKDFRASFVAGLCWFRAMEYCFDELNLHRVTAFIYAFNKASWRIMERSGAKRELHLREHVARDGELHDMYGYGLLRREFNELRAEVGDRIKGLTLSDMIKQRLDADALRESAAPAGDAESEESAT